MSTERMEHLSRRERQIMDVVYERGSATAHEVQETLEDAPSYSSVRTLLGILVDKGHLKRVKDETKYRYEPVFARSLVAKTELNRVLRTFFKGSVETAVLTLVSESEANLTPDELTRIETMIQKAKESGR